MAPNRSRALSSPNHSRTQSPNVPKQQQNPKQRARANNAQVEFSPTPTPARAAKPTTNQIRTDKRTPSTTVTVEELADIVPVRERYLNNLRMLKRRDPHITSIFDQFAHVTVYYSEEKLERAGYEGTLFFFERDVEPLYGFYILNRQGMSDYIRYLSHHDVFDPVGDIVYISSLESVMDVMGDKDKTAGLWAMRMDVRESMGDMMMRLSRCLRTKTRYPDEFRYGPDRPVPQQIVFEGEREVVTYDFIQGLPEEARRKVLLTLKAEQKKKAEIEQGVTSSSERSPTKETSNGAQAPATNGIIASTAPIPTMASNMSELDLLFSKLAPSAPPQQSQPPPDSALPQAQVPTSGKSLLETMFASVSTPALPIAQSGPPGQKLTLEQLGLSTPAVSSIPQSMDIASPKPSQAGMPQILTTNVINDIMGYPKPGSRSASRTSASTANTQSPSSAGARRNRDQGYAADTGEDDGILSEASATVDRENGHSAGSVDRTAQGARPNFLSSGSSNSLKGDATPRARAGQLGLASPPTRARPGGMHAVAVSETTIQALGPGPAPNGNKRQSTVSTNAGSRTVSAPSTIRQSTTFQSGAELWANGVLDQTNKPLAQAAVDADIEEVPELDFSEIGRLNDSRVFDGTRNNARKQNGSMPLKDKPKANGIPQSASYASSANGTPTKDSVKLASLNAPASSASQRPKQTKVNGKTAVASHNTYVEPDLIPSSIPPASANSVQVIDAKADVVNRSIRSALLGTGLVRTDGQALDRNAFVREVLTLVHTDKSFVDKMYQNYLETLSTS